MPPGPVSTTPGSVEALLRDLGPQLRRGEVPIEAPPRWPTGIAPIDELLGGGFPGGRLAEISGPVSSGRTAIALTLLAETTRAGESVAVVDLADAFDPISARAAGVRLELTLWIRPRSLREAFRGAELLLDTRGFALVALDLATPAAGRRRTEPIGAAVWQRLARATARTQTALVAIGSDRIAGSAAEIALTMRPARARFTGTPPLLEGLDAEATVARNRSGPSTGTAAIVLRFSPLAGAT